MTANHRASWLRSLNNQEKSDTVSPSLRDRGGRQGTKLDHTEKLIQLSALKITRSNLKTNCGQIQNWVSIPHFEGEEISKSIAITQMVCLWVAWVASVDSEISLRCL